MCSLHNFWISVPYEVALSHFYFFCVQSAVVNKTLGRAQDPQANGAWLSKLTE